MSYLALILRSLRYFLGVNAAQIAGMMVATAVLTGALMVGSSVQESLADLARQRLGKIDDAVIARRFFSESLAARLAADPQVASRFNLSPGIFVQGGASDEGETVRAGTVQIGALGGDWAPVPEGKCIINGPVADALGTKAAGATILLSVPNKPDQPRQATLARRSRQDLLESIRSTVQAIDTRQDMLSLFNPNGGQRVPRNAWINLPELQDDIQLRGSINTLLAHDNSPEAAGAGGAELLNRRLKEDFKLEDFGLKFATSEKAPDGILSTSASALDPPLVTVAETVAKQNNIPLAKVSINLVTTVRLVGSAVRTGAPETAETVRKAGPAKDAHYAVAAGVSPSNDLNLAEGEIAINQWMADFLGAKVGDRLVLTYYKRQSTGDLDTVNSDSAGFKDGLRIVRILPMNGIGADQSFTPEYRGLTDARSIADWDPPEGIQIDKKLVTKADEDYWHKYRAAPKLFVSFETTSKLWGGPIDEVTSLRFPAARLDDFRQKLQDQLDPAVMGVVFQPILAQQLAASSGNTDFGQYFIYFSFFIIFAAVMLVAMLFRLNIEQRARQLGLLSALGFGPWPLRRLALSEGMILAVIGGLLGLPAAIGYTAFVLYGLTHWWIGAVGTSQLRLHVSLEPLLYGYFGSLLVAFFAILWAVWRIGKTQAATLLAGGWGYAVRAGRSGIWLRRIAWAQAILAVLLCLGCVMDRSNSEGFFLGGGTLLLSACLCWAGGWLRPGRVAHPASGLADLSTVPQLGVRNASRHTARSVLAIGLIAFAAFTLITVAAFRQGPPTNTGEVDSGAGGYRLIVNAGIPLLGDLNTLPGRRILGMTNADDALWNGVHFVSMRRWAGQDISCLNLTQPTTPTILSVPNQWMSPPDDKHPHRFAFASGSGNQWTLLAQAQPDGAIPVIADDATAQYVMHLDVGQTLDVPDAAGVKRHLKLVATLSNSIFQSELLMSQDNFRKLYPTVEGFGVVLVDCPEKKQTPVLQALNTQLGEYAVDTEPTSYRIARYLDIQNTYLSTFESLGALGLMLGTIGLAVVLVRTVVERRAELALLASLGFRELDRVVLILSENLFLLVVGLIVGVVCALVGIIPAMIQSAHGINFSALGLTMAVVLIIGVVSSSIAVWLSGARVTPADLRRE
jgi:ABC-type antimicrobial peptide transport system permease subunit